MPLAALAFVAAAASFAKAASADDAALARARETLAKLTLEDKIALTRDVTEMSYHASLRAGLLKDWKFCGLPCEADDGGADGESEITFLPSMSALSATWNTSLAEAAGDVIGAQSRALGTDMVLAPSVSLATDPLGADNIESFGEDPLLVARMAVPFVKAMQRSDVAACVKTFGMPRPLGERARNELHYRQFRATTKDGGAMGVLTQKGVFAPFVKGLLRERWGFDGMVVGEAGGGENITTNDVIEGRVSVSHVDEAALRLLYTMERVKYFVPWERSKGEILTTKHKDTALSIAEEAITLLKNEKGTLPLKPSDMKNILVLGDLAHTEMTRNEDDSWARPIEEITPIKGLEEYFKGKSTKITQMKLIDRERVFTNMVWQTEWFDNVKEPQEMALKTESTHRPGFGFGATVPLAGMNNSAFCVRWTTHFTAPETGEYALSCRLDETAGAAIVLDGKELARSTGKGNLECMASLNKDEAYELSVIYIGGEGEHRMRFAWQLPSELAHFAEMREKAKKADAVLVFTGTQIGVGRAHEGGGSPRPNLRLPAGHDTAIEEILSWKSPKVVVINHSAGPVEFSWVDECPTLLQQPYLGQEAGRALAKVLFGDVAPSGKLTCTWPKRLELSPGAAPENDEERQLRAEGFYIGYRWYDKNGVTPMFPFGHGLSYTKFLYDMDKAEIAKFGDGDSWSISLPVKNVGTRAGKETVQIYAAYPNAKESRPVKELKGFAKTKLLKPGEQETLTVKIKPVDFAYWDDFLCRFRLDAGEYQLIVAASASDIRGKAKITISNDYIFEE